MYHLTVSEEWKSLNPQNLWLYNKLQLSQMLGYTCGPAGLPVPTSGFFIVRPSLNFMGMSRYARIEYLHQDTEHLHPGEFWCEIFEGEHISVDYHNHKQKLTVRGTREDKELYKWKRWERVEMEFPLPSILSEVDCEWINCEFIGDKLIEVHLRRNPDFRYDNDVAIPVWGDEEIDPNRKYIEDRDYYRKGFYIE